MSSKLLHGVVVPMVTPLHDDMSLDREGTVRLVEHLLHGGVHGLFVLGTTGEATDIPYAVRNELIALVCETACGRVPVAVGITDTEFCRSVQLAAFAKECGATALVAAPPYYFAPSQIELLTYYTRLADSVALPLYLYNIPAQTKVRIDVGTVVALARHENIIGLKDSSGDICYFNACRYQLRENKRFSVLMGPEDAMGEAVIMGADGGVAGGANISPSVFVEMYNAAVGMDVPRVRELQDRVMRASSLLYGIEGCNSSFVRGVKCALSELGICSGAVAVPRTPFTGVHRDAIVNGLKALGITVGGEK